MSVIKTSNCWAPLLEKLRQPTLSPERIALADDRSSWFEAIRDPNDPLLCNTRSRVLSPSDFLSEFPAHEHHTHQQTRLYALKQRIDSLQRQQESDRLKQAKEAQFIKGLFG